MAILILLWVIASLVLISVVGTQYDSPVSIAWQIKSQA